HPVRSEDAERIGMRGGEERIQFVRRQSHNFERLHRRVQLPIAALSCRAKSRQLSLSSENSKRFLDSARNDKYPAAKIADRQLLRGRRSRILSVVDTTARDAVDELLQTYSETGGINYLDSAATLPSRSAIESACGDLM